MSQSTIYNLPRNELTPGPNLSINKGSDSMVTASMDFRCVKGDLSGALIQTKLRKGTAIFKLYPDIGSNFNYLFVDGYDSNDVDGGVTVVTVKFKGVDTSDDSQNDGEDVTYSRNDALQEESIFNNPNYVASSVSPHEATAIQLCLKGLAYTPKEADPYSIYLVKGDIHYVDITDPESQWWFDYIVTKGNHTWNAPVSEWTKSATGKNKLSDAALSGFGWIDTPPGSPAAPSGHDWQFSGATESITQEGDGVSSYSLSWTSGRLESRVYKKPAS